MDQSATLGGRWIYVPDQGTSDGWTGRVWREGEHVTSWRFEMVRHVARQRMESGAPFLGTATVGGLLDMRLPCTLLRAFVTRIDPGMLSDEVAATRIEGRFGALLAGFSVENDATEIVLGFMCRSPTFAAWYGGRRHAVHRVEPGSATIEAAPSRTETVRVPGLGTVTVIQHSRLSDEIASAGVSTETMLRVDFDARRSTREAVEWCIGFELLFGFLSGARLRPPAFRLLASLGADGDTGTPATGYLEVAGLRWSHDLPPPPFSRLHMRERYGVGLAEVLTAFASDRDEFMTRIGAIDEGRRAETALNIRFSTVMPILERVVKSRFNEPDEESFLAARQAFFDLVGESADPDVAGFCRKHLKVVASKAPSLVMQLRRCFATLERNGFRFPAALAKDLVDRRAAAFHSAPIDREEQVSDFYRETRAATAALLILTLHDLGVPIAPIADEHHALPDLSDFLKPMAGVGREARPTD